MAMVTEMEMAMLISSTLTHAIEVYEALLMEEKKKGGVVKATRDGDIRREMVMAMAMVTEMEMAMLISSTLTHAVEVYEALLMEEKKKGDAVKATGDGDRINK